MNPWVALQTLVTSSTRAKTSIDRDHDNDANDPYPYPDRYHTTCHTTTLDNSSLAHSVQLPRHDDLDSDHDPEHGHYCSSGITCKLIVYAFLSSLDFLC